MRKIEISYSRDSFDNWRLSKAGGCILIKANGKLAFQFKTQAQYDEYLRLNSERYKEGSA